MVEVGVKGTRSRNSSIPGGQTLTMYRSVGAIVGWFYPYTLSSDEQRKGEVKSQGISGKWWDWRGDIVGELILVSGGFTFDTFLYKIGDRDRIVETLARFADFCLLTTARLTSCNKVVKVVAY